MKCLLLECVELPEHLDVLTDMYYFMSDCHNAKKVKMPFYANSLESLNGAFNNNYKLKEFNWPLELDNLQDIGSTFVNCYSLDNQELPITLNSLMLANSTFQNCKFIIGKYPNSMDMLVNQVDIFSEIEMLHDLYLPLSAKNLETFNSFVTGCKNLINIYNLDIMETDNEVNCTDIFIDSFLIKSLIFGIKLSALRIAGSVGNLRLLNSLRLSNPDSLFSGESPQIDISYTSLDKTALELLFNDLPAFPGTEFTYFINLQGIAAATPIRKTITATAGSNIALCADTSNLTEGMLCGGVFLGESAAVSFADTEDLVQLTGHGLPAGRKVMFVDIVETTGIDTFTTYYVINPLTDTFQISDAPGGDPVALTGDGTGSMLFAVYIETINTDVSIEFDVPLQHSSDGSESTNILDVDLSILLFKNWAPMFGGEG